MNMKYLILILILLAKLSHSQNQLKMECLLETVKDAQVFHGINKEVTGEISIFNNKRYIKFKTDKNFDLLNKVKINLKKNIVKIDKQKLSYRGLKKIMVSSKGSKLKWEGHRWQYENPTEFKLAEVENLKGELISFSIGYINKENSEIFILYRKILIDKGKKMLDEELPLIVKIKDNLKL